MLSISLIKSWDVTAHASIRQMTPRHGKHFKIKKYLKTNIDFLMKKCNNFFLEGGVRFSCLPPSSVFKNQSLTLGIDNE